MAVLRTPKLKRLSLEQYTIHALDFNCDKNGVEVRKITDSHMLYARRCILKAGRVGGVRSKSASIWEREPIAGAGR